MDKRKFVIGEWVKVKSTVYFVYQNDKRVVRKRQSGVCGQIVGARIRFTGEYCWPVEHEPSVLKKTGRVIVWQIAIGYLNKPIEALEEDIESIPPSPIWGPSLPWKWTNPLPWNDRDKEQARRMMKYFPRDKKGRWVK